ncbi:hypothetical protein EXD81_18895 [Bacillus amyloliquefaciens]|nr:hypothetical protein EXD81_18895 [Bacillus amyloliquefaciens]
MDAEEAMAYGIVDGVS